MTRMVINRFQPMFFNLSEASARFVFPVLLAQVAGGWMLGRVN